MGGLIKMIKKQYCPYCGNHIDDGCECEKEISLSRAEFIEEYENRPDVLQGWRQQDMIDMRKREC
jgi:hypothetical protein